MRAVPVTATDVRVIAGQLGRRPRPMSAVAARCPHGYPAVVEMLPLDEQGRPFPTLYYLTCPTAVAALGALEGGGGVARFQRAVDADEALRASLAGAVRETRARRRQLAASLAGRAEQAKAVAGHAERAPSPEGRTGQEGSLEGRAGQERSLGARARQAQWGGGHHEPAKPPGEASGTAPRLAACLTSGVGGVADVSRLKCLHAHAAHALARPGYRLGAEILAAAGGLWCDDRRCAAFAEEGAS